MGGGFDGVVRLWGPRSAPMPEPSDRRGCPVTAVAAGATAPGLVVAAHPALKPCPGAGIRTFAIQFSLVKVMT